MRLMYVNWIVNHIRRESKGDFALNKSGDYDSWSAHKIDLINIKPLSKAGEGDFSFCSIEGDDGVKAILDSKATCIICPHTFFNEPPITDMMMTAVRKVLIFVEQPRLWFMRILNEFRDVPADIKVGVNSKIEASVILGVPGFGYERDEAGELNLFPHFGGVQIGDFVEIGALSCVERATLPNEYTVIGDRCKIDRLCLIGHNSKIGKDVGIAGGSIIGGSVQIGDGCFLGLSVTVDSGVKIGKRCLIGNGANIRNDVSDGSVMIGNDQQIGYVDEKNKWKKLVGL